MRNASLANRLGWAAAQAASSLLSSYYEAQPLPLEFVLQLRALLLDSCDAKTLLRVHSSVESWAVLFCLLIVSEVQRVVPGWRSALTARGEARL